MVLSSCLYEGSVFHARLKPRKHQFKIPLFFFYLNLDEIEGLQKRFFLLRSYYQFRDNDHLPDLSQSTQSLKQRVVRCLQEEGVAVGHSPTVMMLTHLRVLGYVFNPVTFYFCWDETGIFQAAMAEVENTFHEKKVYVIRSENTAGEVNVKALKSTQPKLFYVSPFSELDMQFNFRLSVPDDRLNIAIDTLDPKNSNQSANTEDSKVLVSLLEGQHRTLTAVSIFSTIFRYPLMTVKVIGMIHWHAFLLVLKRIPFQAKSANLDLQQGIMNPGKRF